LPGLDPTHGAGRPTHQRILDAGRTVDDGDVDIVNDPASIKDALVRQAASAVRWVETVQKMSAEGVAHVVECGPGKVLAGLTKRINGDLTGEAIVDQASLDKVLEMLK